MQPSAAFSLVLLFAAELIVGLYALKALLNATPDEETIRGITLADTITLVAFTIIQFISSKFWQHIIPTSVVVYFGAHITIGLALAFVSDADAACLLWHTSMVPASIAAITYIVSRPTVVTGRPKPWDSSPAQDTK